MSKAPHGRSASEKSGRAIGQIRNAAGSACGSFRSGGGAWPILGDDQGQRLSHHVASSCLEPDPRERGLSKSSLRLAGRLQLAAKFPELSQDPLGATLAQLAWQPGQSALGAAACDSLRMPVRLLGFCTSALGPSARRCTPLRDTVPAGSERPRVALVRAWNWGRRIGPR